jgi:hypothetical protein
MYVASLPAEMQITRTIEINGTPDEIFPFINHSQKANNWMPWKDSDPDVVLIYSGPEEGIGSKSSWDSPGQMGTGEALVIDSIPNQVVKTKLTYTKPFQMQQLAEIALMPAEAGTKVRWSVSGERNFFFKLIGVFVSCDEMVGGEFEKGLRNLKRMVEDAR